MLLVSCDSKYLFSVNGSRLNVHSVLSGEIVYRLSYANSNSSGLQASSPADTFINAISLNPHNKFQLLSYHKSGAICLWDYEDGLLIRSFDSKLEIKKVITIDSNVYAVGRLVSPVPGAVSEKFSLYKLLIKDLLKSKTNIVEHELLTSNLDIDANKFQVVVNYDVKYVAYIQGKRRLVIKQLKNGAVEKTFKSKEELTCLAIHPNEDCIATGTKTGKIIVWYNYLESMNDAAAANIIKPTMNILHWHALAVLSLCFSTEGSYLLSGGHECVLVKWMFRSGQKDFKPRLGAPLDEIACSKDNTIYAVRHIDNTIQLIGQNLNIIQTFAGFICANFRYRYTDDKSKKKLAQQVVKSLYPAGLSYFSRLNCLVTNGKPGHLQFYAHTQDKLLFNLDIVDENYISPENLDRPNVHTEIELVAFNAANTWMATVERRDDSVNTPEIRLKFWQFDQTTNKFTLNTLVRNPHSFDKVNRIKFMANENRLVTCGNDGCFKSWSQVENRPQVSHGVGGGANEANSNTSWVYSTCNGYRDLTPADVDTVQLTPGAGGEVGALDGSLVAVAFSHIVVLWHLSEYSGLDFVDDLINCDPSDPVKQVRFVRDAKNDRLNHVVVVHANFINVWRRKSTATDSTSYECVWSHGLAGAQVTIHENPLSLATAAPRELLLTFVEATTSSANSRNLSIKVGVLHVDERETKLTFVQKISSHESIGPLNCICVSKSADETSDLGQANSARRLEELKKSHFYHCDNRGIIQRVSCGSDAAVQEQQQIMNENDELDEDSMWANRISLAKKIAKSSLSTLMEQHKTSASSANSFLQSNDEIKKNFDENMRKIEMTPAYLLPKVGSFCLMTLKSMFKALNEPTAAVTMEPTNKNRLLNGDID